MDINYIGEHLWPGRIGHLFVIIAFISSILASASYFLFTKNTVLKKDENLSWLKLGNFSFVCLSVSVVGIITTLFYIIYNHYYEYHYAWQHSNNELPVYYMISCFWEGQEGSFLLWAFWQMILGFFVFRLSVQWRAPVLAVLCLSQALIISMLLGVYFWDLKLGSSPFLLLRDVMLDAPIFQKVNYLDFVNDGKGLNPLLQNYWMVIHPPTLFLGFASTIIPFGFAVAGLWTKNYGEWIKPALPWVLFSVGILGTGILMGGIWAYEALTFGGFWAWDPVENASLIPWITIVACLHVMLIYNSTKHALLTAFILALSSFLLVLYASFLTRSGILGDSSVHSFTDLGLGGQLVFFILIFSLISFYLLFSNRKNIQKIEKEESANSREFWMFIGALILCISAFQIGFSTSTPVINKIFGTNLAPPVDAVSHYNSWQIPVAILILILTGIGQFFKYKINKENIHFKKLIISLITALLLSGVIFIRMEVLHYHYFILLAASTFTVFANMDYIIRVLNGKIKLSGGGISHIGFGLLVLGALISQSKQKIISTAGVDMKGFDEKNKKENMLLEKHKTVTMDKYRVTYLGYHINGPNIYYKVQYVLENPETGKKSEKFTLFPNAQINPNMGLIANPDTRHYLYKDIYTHVTSVPDNTKEINFNENTFFEIKPGDTLAYQDYKIVLSGLDKNPDITNLDIEEYDIKVGAELVILYNVNSEVLIYKSKPLYLIKDMTSFNVETYLKEFGLKFSFTKILPEKNSIQLGIAEQKNDYIVMKAIAFPFINLLWLGAVVMVTGIFISMKRRKEIC